MFRHKWSHLLRFAVAIGLVAMFIPSATATATAAPDLSGFVPDFTAPIVPYRQGVTVPVSQSGVSVTVTSSTAQTSGNNFLYLSNSALHTTLTFDKPIPGFRAETSLNADCLETLPVVANCFEQFDLVGKDASGTVVFTKTIRQTDGTFDFVPGTGAGQLSGPITTLEIDYSYDTPIGDLLRGSFLGLWLSKSSLSPLSQTVSGTQGSPITATGSFTTTGFAGAVTYAVSDGTLPAGLSLDPATGVISGTPTGSSNGSVAITATGATSGTALATVSFDIARNYGPPPTTAPSGPTTTAPSTPTTTVPDSPTTSAPASDAAGNGGASPSTPSFTG